MLAPAKINLDLLITGRREDGYHLLDSIVVFTDIGDELTAEKSDKLSLVISGPYAEDLNDQNDNLILLAARQICEYANIPPHIKFHLNKKMPISSGIGGGSADAAAALKLCIELFSIKIEPEELNKIALELGSDVPVCLINKPVHMTGVGEKISDFDLIDTLHMVLVNPNISVSTPMVFDAYQKSNMAFDTERVFPSGKIHLTLMLDIIKKSGNSLTEATISREPGINEVIKLLSKTEDVLIARMSGSGATCFALYKSNECCLKAAQYMIKRKPDWWVDYTRE